MEFTTPVPFTRAVSLFCLDATDIFSQVTGRFHCRPSDNKTRQTRQLRQLAHQLFHVCILSCAIIFNN